MKSARISQHFLGGVSTRGKERNRGARYLGVVPEGGTLRVKSIVGAFRSLYQCIYFQSCLLEVEILRQALNERSTILFCVFSQTWRTRDWDRCSFGGFNFRHGKKILSSRFTSSLTPTNKRRNYFHMSPTIEI